MSRVDPKGLGWRCTSNGFVTRCEYVPDVPLIPDYPISIPTGPGNSGQTSGWPKLLPDSWVDQIIDWCTSKSSAGNGEKERCRKADDTCYEECQGQLGVGGRTNQGVPYRNCWVRCMKRFDCYKGDSPVE